MKIQETASNTIQSRAETLPVDLARAVCSAIHTDDVVMLTTLNAEGFLHARPMAVQRIDKDATLYFFSNDPSLKTSEIRKNSQVSLSFQSSEGHKYSSLSASARVDSNRQLMASLWKEELREWFPGGLEDPALIVLKLTPELFDSWDGTQHISATKVP